jgi:hypothetical protein
MMFCLIRAQRPCEQKKHNNEGGKKHPRRTAGQYNSPPLQPATSRLNSGLELSGNKYSCRKWHMAGKRE